MQYKKIAKGKVYRLIGMNPILFISTVSKDWSPNIAPIAWSCPVDYAPDRMLICLDSGHKTTKNLKETGFFTACIPHASQLGLVKKAGSVSGRDKDKFAAFGINAFKAEKTGCLVPEGVIGYVECKVKKVLSMDGTEIIIGDVLNAAADTRAFNGKRLMAEKKAGKVLYGIDDGVFVTHGDKIITTRKKIVNGR